MLEITEPIFDNLLLLFLCSPNHRKLLDAWVLIIQRMPIKNKVNLVLKCDKI